MVIGLVELIADPLTVLKDFLRNIVVRPSNQFPTTIILSRILNLSRHYLNSDTKIQSFRFNSSSDSVSKNPLDEDGLAPFRVRETGTLARTQNLVQ